MKSLKKLLISSIILIIAGFLGLGIVFFTGVSSPGLNNFNTGRSYVFRAEDFCNMMGSSLQPSENINLTLDSVKELAEDYLKKYNRKLKISEIMEFSQNYYIEIIEEDTGIGAMELLVDKTTGNIFLEFGPNMMWNLKYGMHPRMNRSETSINMTIDEDKALKLAEAYLNKSNLNEYVDDEAERFYGYYTIHTKDKDNNISGMLSVNGFTGQVWYHSWHGFFIDMEEYH